jgi:DNA-binding CsgD family transcriptional regulator
VNQESPGWDRLETQRALGIAALFDRDSASAVEQLSQVWDHTRREHVDDPGAFPVAGDLVEALVQSGRYDEATAVLEHLGALAREQDHPWGLATTQRGESLVQLARADVYIDAAADGLTEAAHGYGELGLDFDRARTLLSLGVIQRRFKRRGAARTSLEQAADAFERWGSSGWANRARDELDRVSGRRSAPNDRLTPTEQRVASLAVQGLTNKEIASQLVVSVNTVQGHLSRAYAKLGVRSRGQLAQHLAGSFGQ